MQNSMSLHKTLIGVFATLVVTVALVFGLAPPANAATYEIRNSPASAGEVKYMEWDGDISYVYRGVTNPGPIRAVYVPGHLMYSIKDGYGVWRDYYGSGWVSIPGSRYSGQTYVINNGCCVA